MFLFVLFILLVCSELPKYMVYWLSSIWGGSQLPFPQIFIQFCTFFSFDIPKHMPKFLKSSYSYLIFYFYLIWEVSIDIFSSSLGFPQVRKHTHTHTHPSLCRGSLYYKKRSGLTSKGFLFPSSCLGPWDLSDCVRMQWFC